MTSLRFASEQYLTLSLLAGLFLAALAWWLYWRSVRLQQDGTLVWLLPTLRSLAVLLIVFTLAEPSVETRRREGDPGRVYVLIDGSQSMQFRDEITDDLQDSTSGTTGNRTRFERAIEGLIAPDIGLLPSIADRFAVVVLRSEATAGDKMETPTEALASQFSLTPLWSSSLMQSKPLPNSGEAWASNTWSNRTEIGTVLSQALDLSTEGDMTDARTAVVFLTDGQSNAGPPPLAVAAELAAANVPVFTVGFGPQTKRGDLAIRNVVAPNQVYKTDTIAGVIQLNDELEEGTLFTAEVLQGDEVVWQDVFFATGEGDREIGFQIPAKRLFESAASAFVGRVEISSLPIKLTTRVRTAVDEATRDNNFQNAYLSIVAQRAKVLLIDGRSRWETRYLRNVFDRDPRWEVDEVIDSVNPKLRLEHQAELPSNRDELFDYNVVILGDVESDFFGPEQVRWLREFVELRGGGLVVIDGARQHLRQAGYAQLVSLFPVEWSKQDSSAAFSALPKQATLTPTGRSLEALSLFGEEDTSAWADLPALEYLSSTRALPGSEVLLEAVSAVGVDPIMVTRRSGAGRVVFFSSDETWRWRYEKADTIHAKFWTQITNWAMRKPMSLQDDFLSLDVNRASYGPGEMVELSCQLRDELGRPSSKSFATVVIEQNGVEVLRLPLTESSLLPGQYSANTAALPQGDYVVRVEAEGYSSQSLDLQAPLAIRAVTSTELIDTSCNTELLQEIARQTGGKYFAEANLSKLANELAPLSGGRIMQASNLLWQSYGWFAVAISLLVIEWFLRKRAGLA